MVEFLKDLGWLIANKYLSLLCQLEVIFEDAVFQEVQVPITQGLLKDAKHFGKLYSCLGFLIITVCSTGLYEMD